MGVTVPLFLFLATLAIGGADPALWAWWLSHSGSASGIASALSTIDYVKFSDNVCIVLYYLVYVSVPILLDASLLPSEAIYLRISNTTYSIVGGLSEAEFQVSFRH